MKIWEGWGKIQERNFGKVLKENQSGKSQTEGRIGGSEGDADDELIDTVIRSHHYKLHHRARRKDCCK